MGDNSKNTEFFRAPKPPFFKKSVETKHSKQKQQIQTCQNSTKTVPPTKLAKKSVLSEIIKKKRVVRKVLLETLRLNDKKREETFSNYALKNTQNTPPKN